MQERFYEAPGGRLRYLHHPNEGRPALLGLHGFKDRAETFLVLQPLLGEHFELFLLDWPGHGGSYYRSRGCYNIADLFADAVAFSSQVLPESFVLMGHSLGAAVSARMAGVLPEKIAALVLFEGFAGLIHPTVEAERIEAWARRLAGLWDPTDPESRPAARNLGSLERARRLLARMHPRLNAGQVEQMAADLTEARDGGLYWAHDEALNWRFAPVSFPPLISRALWRRVTAPALLLFGEDTNLRPSEEGTSFAGTESGRLHAPAAERRFRGPDEPNPALREIIDHFSDLEYHEIPGSGHNFHREQPERVQGILRDFFRRTGLAPDGGPS